MSCWKSCEAIWCTADQVEILQHFMNTFVCCMSLNLLFTAIETIISLKKPSLMYLRHLGVKTWAVQVHEKTPGSSAKVVQPSATKALWDFYFGCAWENVKSTLRGPTSVLPLLSPSLRDCAKVGMKSSFCLFLSTARYPETPPRSPQSKSCVLWKGNMLWTLRWPVWLRV